MGAKNEKERVVVKKVKPYPFEAHLIKEGKSIPGQIIKLTLKGYLVDLGQHWVRVGEYFQVSFELPALHQVVTAECRVIKNYVRLVQAEGLQKVHTAELHFKSLTDEQKKHINSFLVAIKQIPGGR